MRVVVPAPDTQNLSSPWARLWRFAWGPWCAQPYFRYRCDGFDQLRRPTALLVGYHGRPFTLDLYMLMVKMHRELGRMPRFVVLSAVERLPVLGQLIRDLGSWFREPDEAAIEPLIASGTHLVVCPGGVREAFRAGWEPRYRVDWGQRVGYLKLALRYRLPILPVVATGVDDVYFGLTNGWRLSHRLFGHGRNPLWTGVGIAGLWPLALPWPARIHQRIGPPIDLEPLRRAVRDEADFLAAAHRLVTGRLQTMLDEMRAHVD